MGCYNPIVKLFPENISTYGQDIDRIFYLIYNIVGVWFVAVLLAMLAFVFFYRFKPNKKADYITGRSWQELLWILVPGLLVLLLDLGIDAAGMKVWKKVANPPSKIDLTLHVVAKQFNWEFRYAGPDKEFQTEDDIVLNNEVYLPKDKNILLRMTAEDVIHSFFLPNARIKQDIIPGRTTQVWFNLTKSGKYEVGCTELCGYGHYNMRAVLHVYPEKRYSEWLKEQSEV